MIHLFKTCMITAFILGLTWSAPLRAQDQRYISIRNTDTIWLPGNICAYQFRLDNGGNDEGFGPLTITLQLKDKYGQTLVTRKMETEAISTGTPGNCESRSEPTAEPQNATASQFCADIRAPTDA